jgi:RimJ/RimL family protein N-acetyltransferase/8-oxo-dGTP pyrophosphatase MutT (NUDIX family)
VAESAGPEATPPPQPTLRDGDVTLRPWTFDDVDPARLQHDEEIAHWFGWEGVVPSAEQQRTAIERWHASYADDRRVVSFMVEHRGEVAGTVEVRRLEEGNGRLSWAVFPRHRGFGVASRSVRLLVGYAFEHLALERVFAEVEPDNVASLRTAGRAGLRREGVLRGAAATRGERHDYVVLGRLVTDPEPQSRDGFLGILNATLPTKRVIAQGLLRDADGRILLCELTYKREWDLPGGVVDPLESPALALVREIAEELRVDVRPTRLAAANWLPPYRAWSDAVLFVFDLELVGVTSERLVESVTLERREIHALHWCTLDEAEAHVAPYVMRFLRSLEAADAGPGARGSGTLYLEDGDLPMS